MKHILLISLLVVVLLAQVAPGSPLNPWECRPGILGTECSYRMPSGDPFAPGSPLNPYQGRRVPGGTDWSTPLPTPQPLAPGSPLNPIRCRETWGGRVECSSGF